MRSDRGRFDTSHDTREDLVFHRLAQQQRVSHAGEMPDQHVVPTFAFPANTGDDSLRNGTVTGTNLAIAQFADLSAHVTLHVIDGVPSDVLK